MPRAKPKHVYKTNGARTPAGSTKPHISSTRGGGGGKTKFHTRPTQHDVEVAPKRESELFRATPEPPRAQGRTGRGANTHTHKHAAQALPNTLPQQAPRG